MTVQTHYETTQREASFPRPADVTFPPATKRPATASSEPSERNLESPLAVGESREWPKTRGIRALGVVAPTATAIKFGRSLAWTGSASPTLATRSEPLSHDLGSNAKSRAKPTITTTCDESDRLENRSRRFALRLTASEILDTQRAKNCGRAHASDDVQLFSSPEHGGSHFRGLQTCGSVWGCPVCSEKVSRIRSEALSAGIEVWEGQTIGITLTFSHGRNDDLVELIAKQAKARMKMAATRAYKELRAQMGATLKQGGGTVRASEVTHAKPGTPNANGWHPHSHEAWFSARTDITANEVADFEERLYLLWLAACQKVGLAAPDREHGVVASLESAATYVSKWGLGPELTRSDMKASQFGGCNPWQLLQLAHDKGPHWKQAAALFKEYAEAYKGRRQLTYSRGLKALLGIDDKSDTELAEAQTADEAEANHVLTLSQLEWFTVVACEAQADVLAACEHGGQRAVKRLLSTLEAMSESGYLSSRTKRPPAKGATIEN